ncbi:cytochrome c oxidase assembly protein [Bacillus thuringiensis]|uniref:Cytochrome c oxidase assembly protein n=1 Tax=Bacillus thuringiensis TaxID=1428 RepID=A0AAW9GLW5_BACTU|nr:cytochrome c oxidase assembly protein [Bacillus thuringiensis]MDY0853811.1 cytochrome c oxidase assembly protein [Bacillus thuringiensis]MDY4393775.1 cytochrome c oxidase assembly protein [Bacillus thuringiensis]
MNNNHLHHESGNFLEFLFLLLIVIILMIYIIATVLSNRHYKRWPLHRTVFWILGTVCVATAVVGPLAHRAHIDFTVHMLGHLLLGMLAPIFMVLAAPTTLFLRTLNVKTARRLSSALKSRPLQLLSNPIVTTLLNLGGLWILYTTNLYSMTHQNIFLHLFIHLHVFIAGYLFTISMIYIDPVSNRYSYIYRSIILIIALAGHGILSKYIYAHPPIGVLAAQAELGGMLMYYGGDLIDIILIFILCLQWFRASRPRNKVNELLGS